MRQRLPFISGSISKMLVAQTPIGNATTTNAIVCAAEHERHKVPDGDLILAACRRYAGLNDDPELLKLCSRLDEMLDL